MDHSISVFPLHARSVRSVEGDIPLILPVVVPDLGPVSTVRCPAATLWIVDALTVDRFKVVAIPRHLPAARAVVILVCWEDLALPDVGLSSQSRLDGRRKTCDRAELLSR